MGGEQVPVGVLSGQGVVQLAVKQMMRPLVHISCSPMSTVGTTTTNETGYQNWRELGNSPGRLVDTRLSCPWLVRKIAYTENILEAEASSEFAKVVSVFILQDCRRGQYSLPIICDGTANICCHANGT